MLSCSIFITLFIMSISFIYRVVCLFIGLVLGCFRVRLVWIAESWLAIGVLIAYFGVSCLIVRIVVDWIKEIIFIC